MRPLEQSGGVTVRPTRSPLSRKKAIAFAFLSVALGGGASLAVGEILIRASGREPFTSRIDGQRPAIAEPDGVLGWRAKPGSYSIANFTPGGPPFDVTILPDGRRTTGPGIPTGRPIVAVMGCSITQGWGLSDRDTYPWRLQARSPGLDVRNFGVVGYGTYQSLLKLEQLFAGPERPALVLYGLIDHHEDRNVATAVYLISMARHLSRGHAALPYCSLGTDGALLRYPPTHYPDFPPRKYSALANFLQEGWTKLLAKPRTAQKRGVTERLLIEMDGLCRRNNADFAVIMLLAPEESRSHYRAFCAAQKIAWYDCTYSLTKDRQIPGEGHPNSTLNELWAQRISEQLGAKLRPETYRPEEETRGSSRPNADAGRSGDQTTARHRISQ